MRHPCPGTGVFFARWRRSARLNKEAEANSLIGRAHFVSSDCRPNLSRRPRGSLGCRSRDMNYNAGPNGTEASS